ncbi:MAG: gas vesicle protein GvpG [Proteobacteria bacterium]|nr:gas vesicle protein GvpG [Pseudomonadota bacterium]
MLLRGLMLVFQEVADAVEQDRENESAALKGDLRQLYSKLEAGEISEEVFDREEDRILDRLDELDGEPD